jgi:hypothetical protein
MLTIKTPLNRAAGVNGSQAVVSGQLKPPADFLPLPVHATMRSMLEFLTKHRGPVIGLGLLWLVFAFMDVAQRYYFSGQFPTQSHFLLALYIFTPWWIFSVIAGLISERFWNNLRKLLLVQASLGIGIGLIHVAFLAARYWIFWPSAVEKVTYGFVFGEQFFKWFQFEILAYAACALFWFVWLRARQVPPENSQFPSTIALQTDEGRVMVDLDEIEWLRADNNYVIVYAPPAEFRVRATLRSMVEKLHTDNFLQTHRSAAVNIDRATRVERARVELRSGARAPLSRRRRSRLIAMLDSRTA